MSTAMGPDDPRRPAPDRDAETEPTRPVGAEPVRTQAEPVTRPVTTEPATAPLAVDSRALTREQRQQFGGMKIGSSFFGWLAATGMVVLLTAVLAAIGAALGWTGTVDVGQATADPATVGLVGSIVLLVVVFVGYYCGGYVAGRMARFHGGRQGVGVWLWAVVIAILLAILGLIAGTQFDLMGRLAGVPRVPINQDMLTTGGVLTAIGVAVVSLLGAVLGGLAGMRFHRRVDRVDVVARPEA